MARPPGDRDPFPESEAANPDGFANRRRAMVEDQLSARGIASRAVLDAMGRVPRERFVPGDLEWLAYADEALGIEAGQTISQPYIVARMTELLEPHPGMRVLEVGTGSGYQAAILAEIGCSVISIERHPELAEAARRRLESLGLEDRVRIEIGDGTKGLPAEAPFEGIIVTAAAPRVPPSLEAQLADGGRLVIPVGSRERQELLVLKRERDRLRQRTGGACVFVPLVGEEGYSDEDARRPPWAGWL